MRILCPTNNPEEIEPLVKAGADEFYCGVLSSEWSRNYTNVASANRREFKQSNLSSFTKLKNLVEKAHSFKKPVFLTLNAFYTESQFPRVLREYKKARSSGADGFIIADIALIHEIKKIDENEKLIMSTGATIFNPETAKFYKGLGVKRLTLPRHLTIKEIKDLAENAKGTDFEIFVMNTRCNNIDGFCTYQHGIAEVKTRFLAGLLKRMKIDSFISGNYDKASWIFDKFSFLLGSTSACCLSYNIESKNKNELKKLESFFGARNLVNHCGACALYGLRDSGIKAVKIVGRQFPTKKKIDDVRFIKGCLDCLKKKPSKQDYTKFCKDSFKKIYKAECNEHCYYI